MVTTILLLFYSFSFALDESKKETVVANALTKVENDEKVIDPSVLTDAEEIKSKCSTNLVACHFQLSNHRQVVSLSTDLLSKEETSKNVKLLYRRGVSNLVCTMSQQILLFFYQTIFSNFLSSQSFNTVVSFELLCFKAYTNANALKSKGGSGVQEIGSE